MAAIKSRQMDMCHGPLLWKILIYALPLMCTNVLQLLFQAADLIVIGRYAPHDAMAAIGSTGSTNALVVSVFIGISIGANVLAARYFGAGDKLKMRRVVHTAMAAAIYGGIVLMIAALLVARPLLVLLKTPDQILGGAQLYLSFCFLGIPFLMIYNVGCALLRAVGDTLRPFYFMTAAGIVNVLLNLLFVTQFGMEVGGVAFATLVSQGLSAWLTLRTLRKSKDSCHLEWKAMHIDWQSFHDMLKIGIPAGLQSSCFALSNMTVQSSINSFGSFAIAGCTASGILEALVWIGSYSLHQAVISFVAQNHGGKQYARIIRSIYICLGCGALYSLSVGGFFLISGRRLLGIFNPDPEVIRWGLIRARILFSTHVFCSMMDILSGAIRGLGYSLTAALSSLFGACVFRIWWVFCVFPHYRSMESLIVSYPISWFLVALFNSCCIYGICRHLFGKNGCKFAALR